MNPNYNINNYSTNHNTNHIMNQNVEETLYNINNMLYTIISRLNVLEQENYNLKQENYNLKQDNHTLKQENYIIYERIEKLESIVENITTTSKNKITKKRGRKPKEPKIITIPNFDLIDSNGNITNDINTIGLYVDVKDFSTIRVSRYIYLTQTTYGQKASYTLSRCLYNLYSESDAKSICLNLGPVNIWDKLRNNIQYEKRNNMSLNKQDIDNNEYKLVREIYDILGVDNSWTEKDDIFLKSDMIYPEILKIAHTYGESKVRIFHKNGTLIKSDYASYTENGNIILHRDDIAEIIKVLNKILSTWCGSEIISINRKRGYFEQKEIFRFFRNENSYDMTKGRFEVYKFTHPMKDHFNNFFNVL